MTSTSFVLLFAVGIIAGFINALAGGSGFLVFPAFIAAGLPPIVANASGFISLAPANLVGTAMHIRYLRQAHHSIAIRAFMALAGGTLGSVVLIYTGAKAFERAVPWLLLLATVLFGLGPWAKAWLERKYAFEGHRRPSLLYAFEFIICFYGGYFGLGMGIVMLAIYELLGQDNILVANAVKNFVITIVTIIGILLFTSFGLIAWKPALVMAAGTTLGGYVSMTLAPRISRTVLRNAILVWASALTLYAFWTFASV
ncbi:MAG TPA: sulfite exporter TauE/SafE family protein [Aestuariivirgaceae bacterium]|jgi:hypothetical protein